jgi:hypothetical protein
MDTIVWVADVGSIKNNKFGWCRSTPQKRDDVCGTDILEFTEGIVNDVMKGAKVALGFECPLFVPVTEDPIGLTSARKGEGDRSWSAGAGCGALAVGLTETAWIFDRLKRSCKQEIVPTLIWDEFFSGDCNLFIWEAFVTKQAKATSHYGDAQVAASSFWSKYPNITNASSVYAENPFSLVGAALLRSGITSNLDFLRQPVVVIRS